jgi:ribosomal 30S subunit maturation factor RimM
VYLPLKFLPKTDENEITEKKLIGYCVIDIILGELGKITYINSQTAQQLIYVSKDGKEFCFPWHEQFIRNIDSEKRIMEVEIDEEFLNLN